MAWSALRLVAALGCASAASVAQAQVVLEAPPQVPPSIREPHRTGLVQERSGLETRKHKTEAGVAALNAECSRVDEQDASRVADCRARNRQLRDAIVEYRRDLAAFKCALAAPAIDALKAEIAHHQQALRNIGVSTTAEVYEELEQMSQKQLDEFKVVLIEAIVDVGIEQLVHAAKQGLLVAASTGTAQGNHYMRLAREIGADNPHFLEAIEKFSKTKDKPQMARALNEVIDQFKLIGKAAYKNVKAEHSRNGSEFLLKYGNFLMVFVKQAAPTAADELARRFPSLAVDLAKKVTIKTGLAVASPIATFIHDMRLVGYTSAALEELDLATQTQLRGIHELRERMKQSVKKLKEQRAVSAACTPHPGK